VIEVHPVRGDVVQLARIEIELAGFDALRTCMREPDVDVARKRLVLVGGG